MLGSIRENHRLVRPPKAEHSSMTTIMAPSGTPQTAWDQWAPPIAWKARQESTARLRTNARSMGTDVAAPRLPPASTERWAAAVASRMSPGPRKDRRASADDRPPTLDLVDREIDALLVEAASAASTPSRRTRWTRSPYSQPASASSRRYTLEGWAEMALRTSSKKLSAR